MTSPFDWNEAKRLTNLTKVWQELKLSPQGSNFFDIVILSCFHGEQKPLLLSRLMKSSPSLIHYFTQAPAP